MRFYHFEFYYNSVINISKETIPFSFLPKLNYGLISLTKLVDISIVMVLLLKLIIIKKMHNYKVIIIIIEIKNITLKYFTG